MCVVREDLCVVRKGRRQLRRIQPINARVLPLFHGAAKFVYQVLGHGRARLPEDVDELSRVRLVRLREKRVREPRLAPPPRAPYAVHVVLRARFAYCVWRVCVGGGGGGGGGGMSARLVETMEARCNRPTSMVSGKE